MAEDFARPGFVLVLSSGAPCLHCQGPDKALEIASTQQTHQVSSLRLRLDGSISPLLFPPVLASQRGRCPAPKDKAGDSVALNVHKGPLSRKAKTSHL